MIGQIIRKDGKIILHHVKGNSFYKLEDEDNPQTKFVTDVMEKSYVDFTLVQGDRYGITSKARINFYLTEEQSFEFISEIRDSKLKSIGI